VEDPASVIGVEVQWRLRLLIAARPVYTTEGLLDEED
jgi:hypothetical protein